jgi:tetratricopeptide (TPR) repeat protein
MGEQALAHRETGSWAKVFPLLQMRRQEIPSKQLDVHDDSEIIEVLALSRQGRASRAELLNRLRKCVNSPLADPQHRASAALQTMIISDNSVVSEPAHQAYEAIRDVLHLEQVDAPTRLSVEMVYHTAFGDVETAEIAAGELIDFSRHKPSNQYARALRFGAKVYRVAGKLDEAYAAYLTALEIAQRSGLDYYAYWTRISLIWACLSDGDLKGATRWCEELEAEPIADPALQEFAAATKSLVQIRRGEWRKAEHTIINYSFPFSTAPDDRPKMQMLAKRVACENELSGGPSAASLSLLQKYFATARNFVGFEFLTGVLADALVLCGREGEARSCVESFYAVHRRERYPNPAFLSGWIGCRTQTCTASAMPDSVDGRVV